MKVYINIKRNSNLRLHQPFNKRIGLMKKERTHRTLHHFFGASGLMKRWWTYIILVISLLSCQLINSSDFHPPTSLRDKRMEGNATICRQVGRTSDLPAVRPADKERCIISMKRKGLPIPLVLSQAFENRKSHSSLGHFLYAVQAPLKMPQWANGVTPLWTPPFAMRHDRSGRKPTNQFVKPENKKQAWDI